VVGVLLSGNGHDGAAGMIAISSHGGIGLVEAHAEFPEMVENAVMKDHVAARLELPDLAAALVGLAMGRSGVSSG
jgi:chemotaxis response regulator CheB